MVTDKRLIDWLELVSDTLSRPLPDFPRAEIGVQLTRTFDVLAVACDWRDASGRSDFQTWPEVDFSPAADLPPWHQAENLDRHPLIRWFATTQDPTAQAIDRVPSRIASQRDRDFTNEYMRPVGIERQLSLPVVIRGISYEAFVLGRSDRDYTDDELALARQLQRLIVGLHRTTSRVASSPMRTAMCSAAGRAGLTATELAVINLLADGHTAYGIAHRLARSPRTVNKHLENIYRKLGVNDRLRAVAVAREYGVIGA
jgi:DNA-binding CsgD family transcriptional regulator